MINTCDAMKNAFNQCPNGCQVSVGSEQPAYVIETASSNHLPGVCLISSNPNLSKCHEAHPFTIRLCPCQ